MRNKDVVEQFLNRCKAYTLNLRSDGVRLMSYATCIAQFHNGLLIGNETKYSQTTSKHFNMVYPHVDILTTKLVPKGATSLVEYL